jgi:hypothetical protein
MRRLGEDEMFELIRNTKDRFPKDGKMWLSITGSGLTLNHKASAELKEYKRVVLVFDREHWLLGLCPLKDGRMRGSFSLGFVGEDKELRHMTNIRFLKDEILPHIKALNREVFRLVRNTTIPEFENSTVLVADLNLEITNKEK